MSSSSGSRYLSFGLPSCRHAAVHPLPQPADVARTVFRIDGPAVSQFAVQHDAGFVPGLTDKKPIARLIDLAAVPLVQIRIAYEQSNSRHFALQHFDGNGNDSADRCGMLCESDPAQLRAFDHLELIFTSKMPVSSPREHNCADELLIFPDTKPCRLRARK